MRSGSETACLNRFSTMADAEGDAPEARGSGAVDAAAPKRRAAPAAVKVRASHMAAGVAHVHSKSR